MTTFEVRQVTTSDKASNTPASSLASATSTGSVGAAATTSPATVLRPIWPVPTNVFGLVTTRCGGVSMKPYDDGAGAGDGGLNLGYHTGDMADAVAKNRAVLARYIGSRPIAWVDQCHGVEVAMAGDVIRSASLGQATVADAVISDQADEVCAVMVADCLPVLLADTQSRIVGAAHAGWRGLCGGVLERTVVAMRAAPAVAGETLEVLAYLGPSIGPTAFEVGAEVREAFLQAALPEEVAATSAAFAPVPVPESSVTRNMIDTHNTTHSTAASDLTTVSDTAEALPTPPQKYVGDLAALARLRLARVGVAAVFGGDVCTFTDKHRFYSYRRDGRTGRFAALIWRQGDEPAASPR